jgi:hypothetical protein
MFVGRRGATSKMIDPIAFAESALQTSHFLIHCPSGRVGKEIQNG